MESLYAKLSLASTILKYGVCQCFMEFDLDELLIAFPI